MLFVWDPTRFLKKIRLGLYFALGTVYSQFSCAIRRYHKRFRRTYAHVVALQIVFDLLCIIDGSPAGSSSGVLGFKMSYNVFKIRMCHISGVEDINYDRLTGTNSRGSSQLSADLQMETLQKKDTSVMIHVHP